MAPSITITGYLLGVESCPGAFHLLVYEDGCCLQPAGAGEVRTGYQRTCRPPSFPCDLVSSPFCQIYLPMLPGVDFQHSAGHQGQTGLEEGRTDCGLDLSMHSQLDGLWDHPASWPSLHDREVCQNGLAKGVSSSSTRRILKVPLLISQKKRCRDGFESMASAHPCTPPAREKPSWE